MSHDCILCGSHLLTSSVVALPYGSIHLCRNCGSGLLFPRPSQDDLTETHSEQDYFDHPYFSERRTLTPSLEARFKARVKMLEETLGKLEGARLIEVGCDTGLFLQFARDHYGMNVEGVDVVPQVSAEAKKAEVHVHVGALETLNLESNAYDAVVAYDLIEHVADPQGFLCEANRILKPGGVLVFETPNLKGLVYRIGLILGRIRPLSRLIQPLQNRLWPPFHVQYFTAVSATEAIERSKFRKIRTWTRELSGDELAVSNPLVKFPVLVIFKIAQMVSCESLLAGIAHK